jgi:Na+-translocating ferredoxin:NAD+ oxidoreductase RnfG subunit
MTKVIISIVLILNGVAWLKAQPEIDYKPRLLLRELSGLQLQPQDNMTEIILTEAQSGRVSQGKYFTFGQQTSHQPYQYIYLGRVNSCRSGGCSVETYKPEEEAGEYFDYFILFDAACMIRQVRVYNYQATHGQEITAAGWLRQFIGYNGEKELNAGKNIDAISGATISVDGITHDIQDKTNLLKQLVQTSK